ncbi:hypothetical protein N7462_000408 [Penicillium macrosclerotiorum]|uniref:uncharacterized protein n=1 Tax=Penicillium macrosclerotiorum TaxID=303699 RepID=UPI002547BE47|nr:uncharacterized protein N7462_000408 [Penicillium macrosclerotiorum]KAJ5698403.1 hypothetical protein N7462_000408 [Penicillium macrosclerotiorum]
MAEDLLTAIWDCSTCNSCDEIATSESSIARFHPGRLYLGRPRQSGAASALFDVFTSSHSLEYWQELGFSLPKKQVKFAGEVHSSPSQEAGVSDFCKILSAKNNARIFLELGDQGIFRYEDVYALHHDAIPGQGIPLLHVLQEYHLNTPEKVVIAHAIAREFWQLYETKMMLTKWSSGNIWFMPNTSDPTAPLPCKAYISFPFEQAEYELEEYSTTGLIHKCPRIFSLAILLLEIGLGRPIQTSQLKQHERNFVGGMNKDYSTASKLLKELKEQSWGGYTGKNVFDQAIHACMNGMNFSPSQQSPRFPMKPSERREVFYEKVVSPLQWLASSFDGDATCFERSSHFKSSDSSTDATPVRVDELCPSTLTSFHSGKFVSPEEWLDDLRRIGRYIHQIKQQNFVNADVRPIRVAILDSGCNFNAPYFQEDNSGARAGRIKAYKDFVDGIEEAKDSFGHGTFMTALAIEAAPTAEFYVARVAENTAELDGNEDIISKAILWAGSKQKVDIISMSFGVTDNNDDIKNAILQVRAERGDGIIFLASAGNSGPHQDIAFPASRRDVISIRATNYMGTSSDKNPVSDLREPLSFATFSDNIPQRLLGYKPDCCGPGSSVSTAVAAGIAASILSYSALLQLMYPTYLEDRHLNKLRTVEGMEALFFAMSTNMGNRIQFINPVKFFADRPTNLYRLCAIVDCIRKVG